MRVDALPLQPLGCPNARGHMLNFLLSYYGLAILCFLLALCALIYVSEKVGEGHRVELTDAESGADLARRILKDNGIRDVMVIQEEGLLSDHYSPLGRFLALSPDVYAGRTASAAAIAAHEAGHALQHATGSASLWLRIVFAYPAYVGSAVSEQLVILGFAMAGFQPVVHGTVAYYFVFCGAVLFSVCFVCSLLMLINEFDASARATAELARLGIAQSEKQRQAVRSVLTAAALTYVASAVISALQVLYWVARAFSSTDRDSD
jgi:hypothetical protein